jgi:tRNA dimethylallyltransferase
MKPERLSLDPKNKLLIISGPTATGKTALALKIISQIGGEIISADSRQVYQELDIGVGKDHPTGTKIHLIDLITPDKIFSVAEYQKLALQKIALLQSKNILPVVVGGTGFYINSILTNNYSTFAIQPNKHLRYFLDLCSVKLLQTILNIIDSRVYKTLNNSDKSNPRRLIRKIELRVSDLFNSKLNEKAKLAVGYFDILHLSLTAPSKFLYQKINQRVDQRLKQGHLNELKNLLNKYNWDSPGLKTSCYQVYKDYFQDNGSLDQARVLWQFAEHANARQQKTWFSRYTNAFFVDVSLPKNIHSALDLVDKWYNS